ncbi:AzlC family ABC transporter permease [Martelella sp. HB161492]|uniref:AzlC family ABC transporter permease n=1 Tax=Martelella sp. HB161492 TaxID=2720726 RepID=UPI00159250E3|nr:AzlC family ABC transporter permease [Martelella sp. HB161492]
MHKDGFLTGLKDGLVPSLSAAPFGVLFGAVAVAQGQTVFETALMSITIFAGASQLVGVELFGHRVAAWIIILSIVAVNFRHVLYSAAMTPAITHFSLPEKAIAFFLMTDPQFAETLKRHENGHGVSFVWYLGVGLCLYGFWNVMTLIGATLGGFIDDPAALGLDILLPIYFLSLVIGFRKRDNFLPVVLVSALGSVIAYATIGSPWHVSIGALAGIALAAALPPKTNKEASA